MHKGSNFSTSSPILDFFFFLFLYCHPIRCEVEVIVVLICTSLMVIDVVHFLRVYWPFVCLWGNIYSSPLPIFQSGWFLWLFSCRSSLYTLDVKLLSDTRFANIFSHLVDFPFTHLIVSYNAQKFYSDVIQSIFYFCCWAFDVVSKKSLPKPMSQSFLICFLTKVL